MNSKDAQMIRSCFNNGFEFHRQQSILIGGKELTMEELNRLAGELDEAIKKQIPQRPIKLPDEEQRIRYTTSYRCPNCEGGFTGTGFADYCYHCGQALDWTEDMPI